MQCDGIAACGDGVASRTAFLGELEPGKVEVL